MTQEIEQLSRSITNNEVKFGIKKLPKEKFQDQASLVNSTKHLNDN